MKLLRQQQAWECHSVEGGPESASSRSHQPSSDDVANKGLLTFALPCTLSFTALCHLLLDNHSQHIYQPTAQTLVTARSRAASDNPTSTALHIQT